MSVATQRPVAVRSAATGDPRWAAGAVDRLGTWASAVTLVRVVACVVLCGVAATAQDPGTARRLLAAALAVHWAGDIADGALARRLGQETVTGAVLDIAGDRLCVCAVYLGFLATAPGFAVPVMVYLVEFVFVDTVLSLAFLRVGLVSPNYFHLVDRRVWRWNWWQPAKALNSALVAVLCVLLWLPWLGVAVAAALLVVKGVCLVRVTRAVGPARAGD